MHVNEIIARWGYLGVGLGAAIEGETIVITAGALAHKGLLSLPLVMVVAFVGAVVGDQMWFQIGRRFGKPFIDKRPSIYKRAARIDKWMKKFGSAFVVAFRFLYGLRMATPVFLGARNYPLQKFLALEMTGAAIWAVVISGVGYLLGASLERVLHRAGKIEEIVIAAIAATAVFVMLVREITARRRSTRTKPAVSPTLKSRSTSSPPTSSNPSGARSSSARGSTADL